MISQNTTTITKIGVLTSGGDSPGMNACIRAIVRTAAYYNINTIGFLNGYEGLIDNKFTELTTESVSGIIHKGGTILKTSRSERFKTANGLSLANEVILKHNLNGLIVIGGDGSFKGAQALSNVSNIAIVGCAGTIDNDLAGTDFTIGYDTAINTAVEAIDKIRDTAESHNRVFVIEVMGRDAGIIALRSAIAGGAEAVLVPEIKHDTEDLISKIKNWRNSKSSKIIVVAEGDETGGAYKVGDLIKQNCSDLDVRVSVLGHIQRGGNPTCMDRVNASIVGYNAVKALINGHKNEMIGVVNKHVHYTPFVKAVKHHQKLNADLEMLVEILGA